MRPGAINSSGEGFPRQQAVGEAEGNIWGRNIRSSVPQGRISESNNRERDDNERSVVYSGEAMSGLTLSPAAPPNTSVITEETLQQELSRVTLPAEQDVKRWRELLGEVEQELSEGGLLSDERLQQVEQGVKGLRKQLELLQEKLTAGLTERQGMQRQPRQERAEQVAKSSKSLMTGKATRSVSVVSDEAYTTTTPEVLAAGTPPVVREYGSFSFSQTVQSYCRLV